MQINLAATENQYGGLPKNSNRPTRWPMYHEDIMEGIVY